MYDSFKSLHELISTGLLFTIIDLRSTEGLISLEIPLKIKTNNLYLYVNYIL